MCKIFQSVDPQPHRVPFGRGSGDWPHNPWIFLQVLRGHKSEVKRTEVVIRPRGGGGARAGGLAPGPSHPCSQTLPWIRPWPLPMQVQGPHRGVGDPGGRGLGLMDAARDADSERTMATRERAPGRELERCRAPLHHSVFCVFL